MSKWHFLLFLLTLIFFNSCDEGRLYEKVTEASSEGLNVTVSAKILNITSWPTSYTVSIAAFEEDNDYALITKSIGNPSEDTGFHELSLSNIPSSSKYIEICVVNRLRQRIASFYKIEIDTSESLNIVVSDPIDVNMFDVIQDNVFTTTCANCHGGANFAAANLYLISGKSYDNLVEKESEVLKNGELRVKKGSRNQSVLYNILAGDKSSEWKYDHSSEITDYNTLELIGAWIDYGAN